MSLYKEIMKERQIFEKEINLELVYMREREGILKDKICSQLINLNFEIDVGKRKQERERERERERRGDRGG